MPKFKRIFIIVLDSLGIGALPDAADYGDAGSNTLACVSASPKLDIPTLKALGLYSIDSAPAGHKECVSALPKFGIPTLKALGLYSIDGAPAGHKAYVPGAAFGRLAERSKGKDTTIGHWEIAGLISPRALPTYPGGFPPEITEALRAATGRDILCNAPYSGTAVIAEYARRHLDTGALIVYTSADSVMQIAAHEELIPPDELYGICRKARDIMQGKHGVGRIIARPFTGRPPDFTRTANRHDFSLPPPGPTLLDILREKGMDVIGVGKISDIFAGRGVSESHAIKNNRDGMEKTITIAGRDFSGL